MKGAVLMLIAVCAAEAQAQNDTRGLQFAFPEVPELEVPDVPDPPPQPAPPTAAPTAAPLPAVQVKHSQDPELANAS
jgi:hypothetical protein